MTFRPFTAVVPVALLFSALPILAPAAGEDAPVTRPADAVPVEKEMLRERVQPAVDRAMKFLASSQLPDGGWRFAGSSDLGVSSLVVKAFARHPDYGREHPITRRGLQFVLTFQQSDGGLYSMEEGYGNYTTSVALMALAAMRDPALEHHIVAAQDWLRSNQWAEGKQDTDGVEIDEDHVWYGGAGYGRSRRPDLSNTQMMLEALHQSGLPPCDPAYQRALKFISRCQMSSRTNDQPFAAGAIDGGFIYSPANGGESKAGTTRVRGRPQLRSYGSMTYAGFKSMLYADVDREDPRVQQAWDWIRRYYRLDSNPNMPHEQSREGLYYYYHTFAKALEAWGEPFVVDEQGVPHDWRGELSEHLLGLQNADGSWSNPADRWQEGNPNLVTAYAVLALMTAIR